MYQIPVQVGLLMPLCWNYSLCWSVLGITYSLAMLKHKIENVSSAVTVISPSLLKIHIFFMLHTDIFLHKVSFWPWPFSVCVNITMCVFCACFFHIVFYSCCCTVHAHILALIFIYNILCGAALHPHVWCQISQRSITWSRFFTLPVSWWYSNSG